MNETNKTDPRVQSLLDQKTELLYRALPVAELKFENAVREGTLSVHDYEHGTLVFDIRQHLLDAGLIFAGKKGFYSVATHGEFVRDLKKLAANRRKRAAYAEKKAKG